jgi:formylglycine-generating enzyme required for sulfatase activity
MWVRAIVATVFWLLPTCAFAQTEKRIALLIGNRAYDASVGVLKNPHNDIAVVGEALARQGFEVLPPIKDARRSAILGGVRELVRRLSAAGAGAIGFLYYSGHGAAEKDTNINYLIPVDAKEPGTTGFWDESVKLDDILKLLDGARAAAKFIVFDACRNELQLPTKDTTKGLVPVIEQQGMFIAYASAPGRTASDRGEKSGPYAEALAAELGKPGVDHLSLFQNVKEAVYSSSGGAQQPWESNGLVRRVYLTGRRSAPIPELTDAAREWARVDKASLAELETFARRQPTSPEADYARARIGDLKKTQVTSSAPQQPTTMGGLLRCESHPDRPACELDANCSWADNRIQCERKSGSLTTALIESSPSMKKKSDPTCMGVEALVGSEMRCLKPGDSFKDCPECPEMVVVPAGSFVMGSPPSEAGREALEGPQHTITITGPLALGKFEVTFEEWDACVAAGDCKHRPDDNGWGRGRRPVIDVSWDDIYREFMPWFSSKTGRTYRLLSEAEWEYAARAGSRNKYTWGNDIGKNRANCTGCGSKWDKKQTAPVGSFAANAFGLHDMHGNVNEWVHDCWHGDYVGAPTDGSVWDKDNAACKYHFRVTRGGSWYFPPESARSATRMTPFPTVRTNYLGFRVARTL